MLFMHKERQLSYPSLCINSTFVCILEILYIWLSVWIVYFEVYFEFCKMHISCIFDNIDVHRDIVVTSYFVFVSHLSIFTEKMSLVKFSKKKWIFYLVSKTLSVWIVYFEVYFEFCKMHISCIFDNIDVH
jgi:hypothetical protein